MAEHLRRWLVLLVFVPFLAWTAEIDVSNPQLLAVDDGLAVSADFRFELNPRLEEAVTKGVVLYFVAEFEINRPRWYWLDEKLASRSQTFSLSYHALTRQYRLSTGGLHQSFSMLTIICIAAGVHQSTCRVGPVAFCWKSPTFALSAYAA